MNKSWSIPDDVKFNVGFPKPNISKEETMKYFEGTPEERAKRVEDVKKVANDAIYCYRRDDCPSFSQAWLDTYAETYVPPCKPEPKRLSVCKGKVQVWREGVLYRCDQFTYGFRNLLDLAQMLESLSYRLSDRDCADILALPNIP